MTSSILLLEMYSCISINFPEPTYVFGFGTGSFCKKCFLVTAPAVVAKNSSSSRCSRAISSEIPDWATPTIIQPSFCFSIFNFALAIYFFSVKTYSASQMKLESPLIVFLYAGITPLPFLIMSMI